MATLSLNSTGVIVRIRSTGTEYGMHDVCADNLIDQIIESSYPRITPLDDTFPAVIIGPLFAEVSEWTCAHSACLVAGN